MLALHLGTDSPFSLTNSNQPLEEVSGLTVHVMKGRAGPGRANEVQENQCLLQGRYNHTEHASFA